MNDIDVNLFKRCLDLYFAPIAKKTGIPLCRVSDSLYEINSRDFIMRIYFEVGHRKSILATLSTYGENREIGIAVIAGYYAVEMQTMPVSTPDEFIKLAEFTAKNADRFCVPYLLGLKDDFPKIIAYADNLIDESGIKEKVYRHPKNVRQEWQVRPQDEPPINP